MTPPRRSTRRACPPRVGRLHERSAPECARFVADHNIDVDAVFSDRWNIEDAGKAYVEFDKQTRGKAVFEF